MLLNRVTEEILFTNCGTMGFICSPAYTNGTRTPSVQFAYSLLHETIEKLRCHSCTIHINERIAMNTTSWKCPYCKVYSAFTPSANQLATAQVCTTDFSEHGPEPGDTFQIGAGVEVRECQNDNCRRVSIYAKAYEEYYIPQYNGDDMETRDLTEWVQVFPQAVPDEIILPEYIPGKIRNDFTEAYLIKNISPKASVALCRYCVQYMIRDFWGISKGQLVDEIAKLEEKGGCPSSIEMLDAIRDMGNFGAHPERDASIIIEVDPEDAQLAIEITRTIIADWYIDKHEREKRQTLIRASLASKREKRKA